MSSTSTSVDPTVILSKPGWQEIPAGRAWFWSAFPQQIPAALARGDWKLADLETISGHWAFVDLRGAIPAMAMDRIRSRPLLAAHDSHRWIITDSVESLRGKIRFIPSHQAAEVFPHMAFTLEDATLLESVWGVQVGSVMYLGDAPETVFYNRYRFADTRVDDPTEYARIFTKAIDTAVSRFLDQVAGRQLVIPLSGGLDSRLMLAWLRKFDAKNVLTFSYGKSIAEGNIARVVAEDMRYGYEFVEYEPTEIKRAWESSRSDAFIRESWTGTSLPHIQDWWAMERLTELGLLADDAIFLPGHTIVGAMHDDDLLGTQASLAVLAGALARHHGNLQGRCSILKNQSAFVRSVRNTMEQVNFDGSDRSIHELFEWYNFKERQAKYINNSLRTYEYFGFSWALPFYDLELWEAWLAGAQEFTATRAWYGNFVNAAYIDQRGREFPTYDPRKSALRSFVGSKAGRLLAKSPIANLLNSVRGSEYAVNHPLAFEAFNGRESRAMQRWRAIRGVQPIGMWANAMLASTWGSGVQLFDEPVFMR